MTREMFEQFHMPSAMIETDVDARTEAADVAATGIANRQFPTDVQIASAVAAPVIARIFGTTSIRIACESDQNPNMADWPVVSLEPSLTVKEAARRVAAVMRPPHLPEFSVAPVTAYGEHKYRLCYSAKGGHRTTVLNGPECALGRIQTSVVEGAINCALTRAVHEVSVRLGALELANDSQREYLTGAKAGRSV